MNGEELREREEKYVYIYRERERPGKEEKKDEWRAIEREK